MQRQQQQRATMLPSLKQRSNERSTTTSKPPSTVRLWRLSGQNTRRQRPHPRARPKQQPKLVSLQYLQ
jgi:hypothetical protein